MFCLHLVKLNYRFFTDYQLQKASGSCHEAAKSFSYILLFFDNPEILEEIKVLVNALKMADKNEKISAEDEFYVNMFQYFANGQAGQKIIMLLTSDSDSDFTYIRIMKRFSKNFNLSIHAVSLIKSCSSLTNSFAFTASIARKDSGWNQQFTIGINRTVGERSSATDDD